MPKVPALHQASATRLQLFIPAGKAGPGDGGAVIALASTAVPMERVDGSVGKASLLPPCLPWETAALSTHFLQLRHKLFLRGPPW